MCVYADGVLATGARLSSGNTWSEARRGFKNNLLVSEDGIFRVRLNHGVDKAKLMVKGKGANLSAALPLAYSTAVTVQLVKDVSIDNECWESAFDAAGAINDTARFHDRF